MAPTKMQLKIKSKSFKTSKAWAKICFELAFENVTGMNSAKWRHGDGRVFQAHRAATANERSPSDDVVYHVTATEPDVKT